MLCFSAECGNLESRSSAQGGEEEAFFAFYRPQRRKAFKHPQRCNRSVKSMDSPPIETARGRLSGEALKRATCAEWISGGLECASNLPLDDPEKVNSDSSVSNVRWPQVFIFA